MRFLRRTMLTVRQRQQILEGQVGRPRVPRDRIAGRSSKLFIVVECLHFEADSFAP